LCYRRMSTTSPLPLLLSTWTTPSEFPCALPLTAADRIIDFTIRALDFVARFLSCRWGRFSRISGAPRLPFFTYFFELLPSLSRGSSYPLMVRPHRGYNQDFSVPWWNLFLNDNQATDPLFKPPPIKIGSGRFVAWTETLWYSVFEYPSPSTMVLSTLQSFFRPRPTLCPP